MTAQYKQYVQMSCSMWIMDLILNPALHNKSVWLILLYFCKISNTNEFAVAYSDISEATGLSESSVIRAMKLIRKFNLIVDIQRVDRNKRGVYRLSQQMFWQKKLNLLQAPEEYISQSFMRKEVECKWQPEDFMPFCKINLAQPYFTALFNIAKDNLDAFLILMYLVLRSGSGNVAVTSREKLGEVFHVSQPSVSRAFKVLRAYNVVIEGKQLPGFEGRCYFLNPDFVKSSEFSQREHSDVFGGKPDKPAKIQCEN